jgi:hypothetical protein
MTKDERLRKGGTDLISTAVIVVMMRRESRDDSDTELICRLFHLGRSVRVYRSGLFRSIVYDEIRVVVLPYGDWNDSHAAGSITSGRVEWPSCERAQKPQAACDAGLS